MSETNAIVLRAPGSNCDRETAWALQCAGARVQRLHVSELIAAPALLDAAGVLVIPGGFTYGDDVAAGRVLACQLAAHLADSLQAFVAAGGVVIGICNGFQVLVKLGLLPSSAGKLYQQTSLIDNDSGRFECRWVTLQVTSERCPLLAYGEQLELPVAHGEGKFVALPAVLEELAANGQFVLRYATAAGALAQGHYPDNPNGSLCDVAGLCDASGRVLGLMPHPERHIRHEQHPRWTRGEGRDPGDGLAIFQRAVALWAQRN
jgi:phosphoribosylformylglycinamidine synthase